MTPHRVIEHQNAERNLWHSAKDQMGRPFSLPCKPERIVSLVPSQTELLFDLGLGERVVGLTRYCIHPSCALNNVTNIGGTKRFKFDAIDALKPDLIIGNKEENYAEGIERLAQRYPVWMSDIETLLDALNMIESIGAITGKTELARVMTRDIGARWQNLPRLDLSVAYLIWKKPYMAVGGGTFINDVLGRLGLKNVLAGADRYPEVSKQQLQGLEPDVLMLSSEPFPFDDTHIRELSAELPHTKVLLVDGELFSWYGSRLALSPTYFRDLLGVLSSTNRHEAR